MTWIPGDLLCAFDNSPSLAHVRNGTVLEYIPLPNYPVTMPSSYNSVSYYNGFFYWVGSDDTQETDFVVRIDPLTNSVVVVKSFFDNSVVHTYHDLSFDNTGRPWLHMVREDPSSNPTRLQIFDTSWNLVQEGDLGRGATEASARAGQVWRRDNCQFTFGDSAGGTGGLDNQLLRYNQCSGSDLGTIWLDDPTSRLNALRIHNVNSQLLVGFDGAAGLLSDGIRRLMYQGTLLQSYAINGLSRVGAVAWDPDNIYIWAGHFPVATYPIENLYKFNINTGIYQNWYIDEEDGTGAIIEVRGIAVLPSAAQINARSWISSTVIGAN